LKLSDGGYGLMSDRHGPSARTFFRYAGLERFTPGARGLPVVEPDLFPGLWAERPRLRPSDGRRGAPLATIEVCTWGLLLDELLERFRAGLRSTMSCGERWQATAGHLPVAPALVLDLSLESFNLGMMQIVDAV
jgi:hypothetical protein